MVQRGLFDEPKLSKARAAVRNILRGGQTFTEADLQRELEGHGVFISGSAATARARDLRHPDYGGYDVRCEKGDDGKWRYRLV